MEALELVELDRVVNDLDEVAHWVELLKVGADDFA